MTIMDNTIQPLAPPRARGCIVRSTMERKHVTAFKRMGRDKETIAQDTGSAITLQNQRDSPLLRLPAEIRMQISKHVLGGYEIGILAGLGRSGGYGTQFRPVDTPANPWNAQRQQHFLALLTVCRQTYFDARLLPFSLNEFTIYHDSLPGFRKFLTQEQIFAIASVRVPMGVTDVEIRGSECVRLEKRLAIIIGSLRRMRGLKRIRLQSSWLYCTPQKPALLAMVREKLELVGWMADVVIEVVLWGT